MNRANLWLFVGAAVASAVLTSAAAAQTPALNTAPKITLQWLRGVSVAPVSITAGATAKGTVTLLRPAANNMKINLQLSGASPQEALSNLQMSGGVVTMPTSVTITSGSDRASFDIGTSASGTWAGTKSFSVYATYGSENVSTSFTVSR
jgi:hypothetical protein